MSKIEREMIEESRRHRSAMADDQASRDGYYRKVVTDGWMTQIEVRGEAEPAPSTDQPIVSIEFIAEHNAARWIVISGGIDYRCEIGKLPAWWWRVDHGAHNLRATKIDDAETIAVLKRAVAGWAGKVKRDTSQDRRT